MTSNTTNLWDIKTRIKDILILNATTKADFRDGVNIRVGLPDNMQFKGLTYPIIFITNDRELMRTKPFAPVTANVQTLSEHTDSFRLIIMQISKDAAAVEESLDGLQKNVMDALRNNFDLRDSDGLNPLVTESQFAKVDNFAIGSLEGKSLDGRILKFMVREIS